MGSNIAPTLGTPRLHREWLGDRQSCDLLPSKRARSFNGTQSKAGRLVTSTPGKPVSRRLLQPILGITCEQQSQDTNTGGAQYDSTDML